MKFFGQLGIDLKLLIAQIINFGLLLWLLSKFLYKPIMKRIEKDEKTLQEARRERKLLEQKQKIFKEQKRRELVEAKERAQKIIKEAEGIAEQIRKRAKKEAEEEKQATIKQIKARLAEIEYAEKSKDQKHS